MRRRAQESLGIAYHRRQLDDVLMRAAQLDPDGPLVEQVCKEILTLGAKLGHALFIQRAREHAAGRRKKI